MTNQEIIELYIDSNDFTKATRTTYLHRLGEFFDVLNDISVANITMQELLKYKVFLQKNGNSNSTYNGKINCLRGFVRFIVAHEFNSNIKLEMFQSQFKNKKNDKSRLGKGDVPMLKEEYIPFVRFVLNKSAKGWVAQRQKVVTLLLSTCGLRRMEVQMLKQEDIDFDELTVFPSTTKGGKPRRIRIPLDEKVAEEIKVLYSFYEQVGISGEYVVMSKEGSYLVDEDNINSIVCGKPIYEIDTVTNGKVIYALDENGDKIISDTRSNGIIGLALKAKVISKKVLPHGLRKSFAIDLRWNQGEDLSYIASVLGHESEVTTEIYTQQRNDAVKRERTGSRF